MSFSTPLDPLTWLRILLDDQGKNEVDISTAPGGNAIEFFVSSPPMVTTPQVTVNGIVQVAGVDFTVPSTNDEVVFAVPPAQGSTVAIRYTVQTFTDTTLVGFLSSAQIKYTAVEHLVYQAAIYAIDTLLIGVAAAFDFGAGQESYRFSEVNANLSALRDRLTTWLATRVEEPSGDNQVFIFGDMRFPMFEPGSIQDDPSGTLYPDIGVFPEEGSGGGLGGLN